MNCLSSRWIPKNFCLSRSLIAGSDASRSPGLQCANSPDMQHLKTLHRISFERRDPYEDVVWPYFSMRYSFEGFCDTGTSAAWDVAIYGTSVDYQSAWHQRSFTSALWCRPGCQAGIHSRIILWWPLTLTLGCLDLG